MLLENTSGEDGTQILLLSLAVVCVAPHSIHTNLQVMFSPVKWDATATDCWLFDEMQ